MFKIVENGICTALLCCLKSFDVSYALQRLTRYSSFHALTSNSSYTTSIGFASRLGEDSGLLVRRGLSIFTAKIANIVNCSYNPSRKP